MLSKEVKNMTDNTIDTPVEDTTEMSDEEYSSAMHELLVTVEEERLGRIIAGVLEFLTMRALHDGPFYITTDDEKAITVFATEEHASTLRDLLPDTYKSWDDALGEPEFLTDTDPGDEQGDEAE
jgi:hypothetical protein